MKRRTTIIVAGTLCLVASIGCKSKLFSLRRAPSKPASATAVADTGSTPSSDLGIGQASYEQLAEKPNADAWGRAPYHFGNSSRGSSPTSFGGGTTGRRC